MKKTHEIISYKITLIALNSQKQIRAKVKNKEVLNLADIFNLVFCLTD